MPAHDAQAHTRWWQENAQVKGNVEAKEKPSIKTLLYKTERFLPRVLEPTHPTTSGTTSLAFWQGILGRAYDSLNTTAPAPGVGGGTRENEGAARIVVYGCDEFAGVEQLVTALLEEPFASDEQRRVLLDRWKATAREGEGNGWVMLMESWDCVGCGKMYRYGFLEEEEPGTVTVQAASLKQFSVPVEFEELRPSPTPSSLHPPRNTTATTATAITKLFAADIPLIVLNPLTTPSPPLPLLLSLPSSLLSPLHLPLTHTNAILAITTTPNSLAKSTVFVDPVRAIGAVRALAMEPGSAVGVQRYQDDWTGSRVGELVELVRGKLACAAGVAATESKEKGKGDIGTLREGSVREQVKGALAACSEVLSKAEREVGSVTEGLLELRDEVAELSVRVGPEVLGSTGGAKGEEEGEVVKEAVGKARREMEGVLGALSWWRAVWRVDEVGEIVRAGVDRAWCRELEDKLIFHAGRLASSQKKLSESTTTLLSQYTAPSPFHSPILENTLSQIRASPSYPVHPSSLTTPIHTRKAQLTYPTQTLHSTAQSIALGTGGSVMSGLGIAWAGWAEHLGIVGDLVGSGMQVETAVGAGMLVCAVGVRWMVGRWERAKRRWWRDWERVGEGLERDLKATLNRTVSAQVTVIPTTASDTLEQMVKKRREEIGELKDELEDLQREVEQSRS
ncbi:hypothetical protein BC629DRAFT_1583679 [Irpex lacteus]|nr:hypothetical protein BC629DRAFT_1583679 [Irpex lacteus]